MKSRHARWMACWGGFPFRTALLGVPPGPCPLQGSLLRRLHPAATTMEARCLLALLAAGPAGDGSCVDGITPLALRAALAVVQDAQQFPVGTVP